MRLLAHLYQKQSLYVKYVKVVITKLIWIQSCRMKRRKRHTYKLFLFIFDKGSYSDTRYYQRRLKCAQGSACRTTMPQIFLHAVTRESVLSQLRSFPQALDVVPSPDGFLDAYRLSVALEQQSALRSNHSINNAIHSALVTSFHNQQLHFKQVPNYDITITALCIDQLCRSTSKLYRYAGDSVMSVDCYR